MRPTQDAAGSCAGTLPCMCTACPPRVDLPVVPVLWFHGTTGASRRLAELRAGDRRPLAETESWHTHLGVHLSSDHTTAAAFAGPRGQVLHARLDVTAGQLATFPDEHTLHRAAADFHTAHGRARPAGWDPDDSRSDDTWLSRHPERARWAAEFAAHLRSSGIRAVIYGNEVEGPYRHPCVILLDPTAARDDPDLPAHPGDVDCAAGPGCHAATCRCLRHLLEVRAVA